MIRFFLPLLILFSLFVDGWSRDCGNDLGVVLAGSVPCGNSVSNSASCEVNCRSKAGCVWSNGSNTTFLVGGYVSCYGQGYDSYCIFTDRRQCSDRCAADSLVCTSGKWNSQTCTCEDGCDEEREDCENSGGSFSGGYNRVDDCCSGFCNLCSAPAVEYMLNRITKLCCDAGKAPPNRPTACFGSSPGGCGYTQSTVCGEGACVCIDPGQPGFSENIGQCNGPTSSADGSSSSGGGDSSGGDSSGGDSSSSGNGEDWEYDYRDSLHKIILATESTSEGIGDLIYCLQSGLCSHDYTQDIRSLGDSLGNVHSAINNLGETTSRLLRSLGDSLGNINENIEGLPDSLGQIRGDLHDLGDSLGDLFEDVAERIGVSTDSLIKHIDSIRVNLPDSLLDSIIKFQNLSIDYYDSAFFGPRGFEKIDSLIDTTVKYLSESRINYDSLRAILGYSSSPGSGGEESSGSGPGGDGSSSSYGYGDLTDSIRTFFDSLASRLGYHFSELGDSVGGLGGKVDRVGDSLGSILGVLNGTGNNYGDGDGSDVFDTTIAYFTGVGDGSGIRNYYDSLARNPYHSGELDSIFDTTGSSFVFDTTLFDTTTLDLDSMVERLEKSVDTSYQELDSTFTFVWDSLKNEIILIDFDSAIISPLGGKVPNTNTCPADCFAFDLTGLPSYFGSINKIDFGICQSHSVLGGMNVLLFIRLIARILVALTCIYIGIWFIGRGW